MWESKDKTQSLWPSAGELSTVRPQKKKILCTVGCSPFITFYSLKHKNILNIFMDNKMLDPSMTERERERESK